MENAGTTGVIPNASNTKKPDRMSGFFIVRMFSKNQYYAHFRKIKCSKLCHLIAINQYVNTNKYG